MDAAELIAALRRGARRRLAGGTPRPEGEEPLRAQLLAPILLAFAAALAAQAMVFVAARVGVFTFLWAVIDPAVLLLLAAWFTRRRRTLMATTLLVVGSSHAAAFTIAHFGLHHWSGALLALTIVLCGLLIGAYFVFAWTLICCLVLLWLQVARLHADWPSVLGWCALYAATGWLVMLFSRHLERLLAADRAAEAMQRHAIVAERTRFAREIHDTLAQGFTGVVIQLNAAEERLATDPAGARRHLATARDLARQNLDEARRSAGALRPGPLARGTLLAALAEIGSQLTAGSAVRFTARAEGLPRPLAEDVETALLRIGQEALTNAVRHAGARSLDLCLRYTPSATLLEVRDDGRGFPAGAGAGSEGRDGGDFSAGNGLRNMAERARQLGGEVSFDRAPGRGTTLLATLPHRGTG